MTQLDSQAMGTILSRLKEPTAKCAMDTFGISIRTWNKLKNGEPVRASLAERLVQRFVSIGASADL